MFGDVCVFLCVCLVLALVVLFAVVVRRAPLLHAPEVRVGRIDVHTRRAGVELIAFAHRPAQFALGLRASSRSLPSSLFGTVNATARPSESAFACLLAFLLACHLASL